MFDLEKKAEDWKDTINFIKKQIEEDPEFPLGTPYALAKEDGSEMSINFRIKDRDLAQGFLQEMMYSDNKELQDLLGIEVYELCLKPHDVMINQELRSQLAELCRFCIDNKIYDPNQQY